MGLYPVVRKAILFIALTHFTACSNAKDVTYILPDGHLGSTVDVMLSVDPKLEKHNLGGMDVLGIWQHGGVSLLRFDLARLPKGAIVKKASLKLYCSSVGFADEEIKRDWPITIHSFEHKWNEGTGTDQALKRNGATIHTFDGKESWPKDSPLASAGTLMGQVTHHGGDSRWYEWSLKTDVVNEWITGKRPNYGMIISGKAPGKAVSFASSESRDSEKRPRLVLTLALPDK